MIAVGAAIALELALVIATVRTNEDLPTGTGPKYAPVMEGSSADEGVLSVDTE
jgi:hypothetical protein